MKPIAIDAFAGAGGLSLGLRQAGWRVALAFDSDPTAVETYRSNIGPEAHELDASDISPGGILRLAGLKRGECDLLAGGPPCQGFSMQRRNGADDPRNALIRRFGDFVVGIRPRIFLMENVPALTSKRGRHLVDDLIRRTSRLGYACSITTLDAYEHGVAQRRLRAVVVGLLADAEAFVWPRRTGSGPRTVRDAIGDLPSPPIDGKPHPDIPNHYREARLSELNRERIRHIPPGGGREHLPKELRLRCHSKGHRHLDTYGRLAWGEPSVTITARFDSFTRGRFGHPVEDRSLTLREGARLQGFPDDFVFPGTREEGARLIGNAVPPPMARALGRAAKRAVDSSADLRTAALAA